MLKKKKVKKNSLVLYLSKEKFWSGLHTLNWSYTHHHGNHINSLDTETVKGKEGMKKWKRGGGRKGEGGEGDGNGRKRERSRREKEEGRKRRRKGGREERKVSSTSYRIFS